MQHSSAGVGETGSFFRRITTTPLPYDEAAAADAIARFAPPSQEIEALIRGAAGCSPYLRDLLRQEEGFAATLWESTPEACFASLCDALCASPLKEAADALRQAKRRVALLCALCDLGGVWSLEEVTAHLTHFADLAVEHAFHAELTPLIARGKLPGITAQMPLNALGLVVLAMGKMGAHELNYSSDIDLIVLFDESRYPAEDFDEIRAGFIRATRQAMRLLSDSRAGGYVFRTDLRLRPDPSVTPVCLSMDAAERYYESLGRPWERAAYIKARPAALDLGAGQRFIDGLRPFIWRRHFDFLAIEETHNMRLMIREHKGLGRALALPGHNVKLGRGGIREIEFFAQTQQLIAGGRDPSLRLRPTCAALEALAAAGWISAADADELCSIYRMHRTVEHRIQMLHDAQTHQIPNDQAALERLAAFCGFSDYASFEAIYLPKFARVHDITEAFFARDAQKPKPAVEARPEWEGFSAMEAGWQAIAAMRSPRAQEIYARLRPALIEGLCKAADPEAALHSFDGFLRGQPAGVQLFSLMEANPNILALICDICATAPRLAHYLAQNAAVLDAVISGDFFSPLPDLATLTAQLRQTLEAAEDYETALRLLRQEKNDLHFRIGVQQLRQIIDAPQAAEAYSVLARACLEALLPCVMQDFNRRHGAITGSRVAILGLGKLGSQEMTATSDLDLIVIYDGDEEAVSDGARSLHIKPYFARFTQAFLNALTAQMGPGRLYEVDMRLRPSGRKGPVATSLESFRHYQKTEAWLWEHLALTRAMVAVETGGLGAEVEALRAQIIGKKRAAEHVWAEVEAMRQRLAEAKAAQAPVWSLKSHAGGMMEIELVAQGLALLHGTPARAPMAQLMASGAHELAQNYQWLARLQSAMRLVMEGETVPEASGQGAIDYLLAQSAMPDLDTLRTHLTQLMARNLALIDTQIRDEGGRQTILKGEPHEG